MAIGAFSSTTKHVGGMMKPRGCSQPKDGVPIRSSPCGMPAASEAFRAAHRNAGDHKPLYLGHPQLRQTVERAKAKVV